MDDGSLKRINVVIAGRSYPVKVAESDETSVRGIEKKINEQIKSYQNQYSTKDKQDFLAMTLFTMAVELESAKSTNIEGHISSKLSELDQVLENILK